MRAEIEDITYDIQVEGAGESQVTRTFNSITVDASFFEPNQEYSVVCKTGENNSKYGYV